MRVPVGTRVRIKETGEVGVVTWRSRELSLACRPDGAELEVDVGRGSGPRDAVYASESEVELINKEAGK
jgi:hypothetical protein